MNRWTLIRDNIITALKTLPFPDEVVIDAIARPTGIAAVTGPSVIGVCVPADRWVMPSEIQDHENQPACMLVQIVISADSATTTTSGMDEINELAAIALKVRNMDVGIYGMGNDLDTGGVYLDGLKSDLLEFTGREPGGAGPIAKVFTLQTTVVPL